MTLRPGDRVRSLHPIHRPRQLGTVKSAGRGHGDHAWVTVEFDRALNTILTWPADWLEPVSIIEEIGRLAKKRDL